MLDIEADDLNATVVWCAVLTNVGTGESHTFDPGECRDGTLKTRIQALLGAGCFIVGHNLTSFDVPTLNRLCDTGIPLAACVDTLVLSYLYHPTMPGGPSLEAWGERLKFPKGDFNDWTHFSSDMLDYCVRDVNLNVRVFKALVTRMAARGFSEQSCDIEHRIRAIVDQQQRNGFDFDIRGAEYLLADLRQSERTLAESIRKLLPARLEPQSTYKYRTRADGTPYASYSRHCEEYDDLRFNDDRTEYTVYRLTDFNIGSPRQRVDRLVGLGYAPVKFTPTGQPKVDEESLITFADESGIAGVRAIADWLVANGRANMINTWLNAVGDDGRMHGRVFTCGAGSRRMTHNSPNTANIPSNEARYGRECRSLWRARSGRVLVGYDAKAAQMRMFAHYLGDAATAELYINGDPHQVNADAIGIPRSPMKNVFYAYIFGAAAKKLGATAQGRDAKFGKFIIKTLEEITPGLRELQRSIQRELGANNGFLRCIDGGFVRCPAEHAALNYKIQSAEACLMKMASILIDERARHIDHLKVGDIHDEGQHDVAPEQAEEFGSICVQAIRDAGKILGFTVPMDGNFKIGPNWSTTH